MHKLSWHKLSTAALALGLLIIGAACADEVPARPPLVGRVETFAGTAEPVLPGNLLGLTGRQDGRALEGGLSESGALPDDLRGEWYGKITISQMDTYPAMHQEPYCQSFIAEIDRFFHQGQNGQISLAFETRRNGRLGVATSDALFGRGLRVMLTAQEGPALVPGGTNLPRTVRDDVAQLDGNRIEQTRIDLVSIVDKARRRLIHSGFTEVTADYQIVAPRRMRVKILNVDYDQDGKPLWKALMEGELRRWSRGR